MKPICSIVFLFIISTSLKAQAEPNPASTKSKTVHALKASAESTDHAKEKPWNSTEQLTETEYQIQAFTQQAKAAFRGKKYRDAYAFYKKAHKLQPSEKYKLEMINCLRAMKNRVVE